MRSEGERLRVLYVINSLGTGGAERSLAEMLEPLRQNGVEVSIACLEHRREGVEVRVRAEHDVRFLGSGPVTRLLSLRRVIEEVGPDLVHTTLFDSDVLGRIASIGKPVPVVTSIVNTSYRSLETDNPDVSPTKLRVARALDGWTARRLTDGFHALTAALADEGARALGIDRSRITVIPRGRDVGRLGVSTPERRARVRAAVGVDENQFLLLSVGRREHQKGQEIAIRAMERVHRESPDAILVIAGRAGAASDRLEEARRRAGLNDVVRFLGHRDDVPDLMVGADLLVFPSLYEGFGGTVIEAMALGLPAIVSDIPTLREVVGDTALVTPPGEVDALAGMIEYAMSHPERLGQLSARARARFQSRYTLEEVALRMSMFYRATLGVTGGANDSSGL